MRRRRPWILVCVAAAALAVPAAAAATRGVRLDAPSVLELGRAAAITDSTLTANTHALLEPGSYWGGEYTTSTGETVTIDVSNSYPQDPARAQQWADFLGGLIHGAELSQVTIYLAPLDEVQRICGRDALACYGALRDLLVAPGDDPAPDTSAEAVLTHEYGHHVAAYRSNAPWRAVDWGTKRWATYEQVCARARAGQLAPGAEVGLAYTRNPGEGFAETYRVLNERAEGVAETPWDVVSRSLYPDDTALSLLQQDVVAPWTHVDSVFRSGRGSHTYGVATPLDGTLRAALRTTGGRYRVEVLSSTGTRLSRGGSSANLTICGRRSVRVHVVRVSGAGSFRLAISRP